LCWKLIYITNFFAEVSSGVDCMLPQHYKLHKQNDCTFINLPEFPWTVAPRRQWLFACYTDNDAA